MRVAITAGGERREDEAVWLQLGIAGVATEEVPLFDAPVGEAEPFLREPVLVRQGTSDYRWTRDPDVLRAEFAAAARRTWQTWRDEAVEMFSRDPVQWAEACARVAGLDDPLRWMVTDVYERAACLDSVQIPVTHDWEVSIWTAAFLGLGPVLDRVVVIEPALFERISAAAAIVRHGRREGSA